MPHPDPDDLALLALGESLGDPVDTHIARCDICQREIESFRQTIGLAELSNYGEEAPPVSEDVWLAITADLGLGDSPTVTGSVDSETPQPPVLRAVPGLAESFPAESFTAESPAAQSPTEESPTDAYSAPAALPPRASTGSVGSAGAPTKRWSRWVAPLAAAVVGIALGAGAVAVLQNRGDSDTVEAVAPLKPVPTGPLAAQDGQQLGQADLVASPTGPQVRINAADLPGANSSAYEVWLFGNDGRMVSLGTLADGNGSFTVPPGISTQEYRVVDISDEPPDGNPAHSGVSLIRGEFS